MDQVLNYLWEASICLAALWLFYRLFLNGSTFFSWNRTYLLLSILAAMVLPAIRFPAMMPAANLLVADELLLPVIEISNQNSYYFQNMGYALSELIVGIYAVGFFFFLFRSIWGFALLWKQINQSRKTISGDVVLLEHPDVEASSFFRYIFLPPDVGGEKNRDWITAHEAVHSRLQHSLDLLLLQLAKALFWFNPIVRLVENALREVHEYQVDEKIIAEQSRKDYAEALLTLIRPGRSCALIHNFNQFQIKKRLKMMNQPKSRSLSKIRYGLSLPLFGLLFVLFACDYQEEMLDINDKNDDKITERLMQGEVFDVVEEMPSPPGGMEGWNQYLMENLSYPASARNEGVEGTVYTTFVVAKDGSVRDVALLRGVDDRLNEAALEVIRSSPNWQPGRQKGEETNVKIRLPIRFKLN
ncbi:TonB family C-terminal domain-containing protein [Cyclobacterium lianum]|uniref:TonB family C-terminal domain-containing protein n=2 Tax=Cyclobacterium lianum TaxID=388280 RepID=A0A1M7I2L5_9BACT|nr:TonB family C-terminal domain-containing protein [Cyclobacterium lianum]